VHAAPTAPTQPRELRARRFRASFGAHRCARAGARRSSS
jgi:hypothetical protein